MVFHDHRPSREPAGHDHCEEDTSSTAGTSRDRLGVRPGAGRDDTGDRVGRVEGVEPVVVVLAA